MNLDILIQRSCALLEHEQPIDGYYGCFSGGKDSCVIKKLCELTKVKIEWHYNVTTIDPPELVYFIKSHHPDTIWMHPKKNFFTRLVEKMPPTRGKRWCCQEYKERDLRAYTSVMGIRIDESGKRKSIYTNCVMNDKRGKQVLPIRLWTKDQVWEFIRAFDVPYCSLYDEGFERIGCIGCPQASRKNRKREFNRWPKYYQLYRQAFKKFWDRKKRQEQETRKLWKWGSGFDDAEAFFQDWVNR